MKVCHQTALVGSEFCTTLGPKLLKAMLISADLFARLIVPARTTTLSGIDLSMDQETTTAESRKARHEDTDAHARGCACRQPHCILAQRLISCWLHGARMERYMALAPMKGCSDVKQRHRKQIGFGMPNLLPAELAAAWWSNITCCYWMRRIFLAVPYCVASRLSSSQLPLRASESDIPAASIRDCPADRL